MAPGDKVDQGPGCGFEPALDDGVRVDHAPGEPSAEYIRSISAPLS